MTPGAARARVTSIRVICAWGEQHLAVRHSGKIDIANVAASPGNKAASFDAANRLADPKAVHGFPRKKQALSH